MQPSQYINTILVPKDGEIPIDVQSLADQGIFDMVCVPTYLFEHFVITYGEKNKIKMIMPIKIYMEDFAQ